MAVYATAAQILWLHIVLNTLLKYVTLNIYFISFHTGFDKTWVHGGRHSIKAGLILHSAKTQATLSTKFQVLWNTTPPSLVKICQCFEDLHTTFFFMVKYFQKNRKSIDDYMNLPARGFNISADFRPHGKPKLEPKILSTSFTVPLAELGGDIRKEVSY